MKKLQPIDARDDFVAQPGIEMDAIRLEHRLRGGVVGESAVPVKVVFGDVEHDSGVGPQRRRPAQLEAGQLDGQQLGWLVQHVQHRVADVAA